ncbi:MAG: MarR family winged helix-turn-helix transcriptional regulator [Candidatus Dormiibacterota bacterium]|jgi:DNA-binding MarR family transcriptional regulator
MRPTRTDVERMVVALFTLNAGLDRARRQSPGAARLSVLQALLGREGAHPSDLAEALQVSPSLVTRHVQALEEEGLVAVSQDPADHRSCLVSLTPTGCEEVRRLQQLGVARFESFVASWDAAEVVAFTRLLEKLEVDKHEAGERARRRSRRPRWADGEPARRVPGSGDRGTHVEASTS